MLRAIASNLSAARTLLDKGANVSVLADGGYTALQLAAIGGRLGMCKLLLSTRER